MGKYGEENIRGLYVPPICESEFNTIVEEWVNYFKYDEL